MAKLIKWSPQQLDFLKWCLTGSGSCILEAVAGAGKTTTLIEAARTMPGCVAILAYNKKIAEEIKEKLQKLDVDWKKAIAGTVHSFGFKAYCKTFGKNVKVDGNKVDLITENMFPDGHTLAPYRGPIVKIVSLAKQRALGIVARVDDYREYADIITHFDVLNDDTSDRGNNQVPEDEIIAGCIEVLKRSNAQTNVIDFDDMCYLPLIHKCRFWQYDVVMVDEAQDTNPARRALVRAIVRKGGRVIAVGDRHQAIYGFTGADNDSLEQIAKDFTAIRLPLTVTYRCPKSVVEFAHQWVDHIQAADSAPQGTVNPAMAFEAFMLRKDLNGDSAILCRTTKPLIEAAFKLIRAKIACKVEGRDIGANLKKLIQRWKIKNLSTLLEKMETYLARETTKLLAKKAEAKLQQIEDQVETVKVIIDQCLSEGKTTIDDALAYIDTLFADDVKGILVLSTIHKSKGREWKNVYWLDRAGTCPNKWARQAWQKEQEVNLQYVAATRAMDTLTDLLPARGATKAPEPKKEDVT